MKPEFRRGSLWIGGEDNYVIEILGNGHNPGLKRVRAYEPHGHTFNEVEFVGNRVARRHLWSGPSQVTTDLFPVFPRCVGMFVRVPDQGVLTGGFWGL
jgi:hypothetical protein